MEEIDSMCVLNHSVTKENPLNNPLDNLKIKLWGNSSRGSGQFLLCPRCTGDL